MKLLRFNLKDENRTMARLGVLLRGERVANLRAAAVRYLSEVEGDSQAGSTARMVFPIPRPIAHLSQMTQEPGDVILTGTPSAAAMGRKPDPDPYFLQVGDVLESEIEGIGAMRHAIVAEPDKERSRDWSPAMGENA